MSRKNAYFLIGISLLIIVGVLGFWYLSIRPETQSGDSLSGNNNLFPFGIGQGGAKRAGEQGNTVTTNEGVAPVVRQITSKAVAGGIVVGKGATSTIRYIERETGHVYQTSRSNLQTERLSNTTIPKVIEGIWSRDGKQILARFLDETGESTKTFFSSLSSSTPSIGPIALAGTFLEENITTAAFLGVGDNIFYLKKEPRGVGILFSKGKGKEVFSSPLTEWSFSISRGDTVALFTKPSAFARGIIYSLNTKNGVLERLMTGRALTGVLSPDASLLLYSENETQQMELGLLKIKTGEKTSLFFNTVPEKCVWANNSVIYCGVPDYVGSGAYPDDWYQGLSSFSDVLWKIDLSTGESTVVAPQKGGEVEWDILSPSVSEDGNYLTFINKKDLSFWGVDLEKI